MAVEKKIHAHHAIVSGQYMEANMHTMMSFYKSFYDIENIQTTFAYLKNKKNNYAYLKLKMIQ